MNITFRPLIFLIQCFLVVIAVLLAMLEPTPLKAQELPVAQISSIVLDAHPPVGNDVNFAGCGVQRVDVTNADFERRVVELTNAERARNGLPPLKLVSALSNAARHHAADMAMDNYFDHGTYDRVNDELNFTCDTWERIRSFYPGPRAENIAAGYRTPEDVVQAWIDSPGHYRNIMSDVREIGVGFYDFYWVQDFGTRDNKFPLVINEDAGRTDDNRLSLYAYGEWDNVRIRVDSGAWSTWQSFDNHFDYTIYGDVGMFKIEVEMRTGNQVVRSSDTIRLMHNFPDPADTAPTDAQLVEYEYFEGSFDSLPDFDSLTSVDTGKISSFSIRTRHRNDHFAFRFRACIELPTAGDYTFTTHSDDGSQLFINGNLLISNEGQRNARERSGSASLTADRHSIEVTYFEHTGKEVLNIYYEGPNIDRQVIPASAFTTDCTLSPGSTLNSPLPNMPGHTNVADNRAIYLPVITTR